MSKSLLKGETSANGIVMKNLKKRKQQQQKKSILAGRKRYHTADAPAWLTAAVSLPLITTHVVTADITATILELLSQHHQLGERGREKLCFK